MSLSQQQSQKISKAQQFTDNSSKNLYYQNQNPSKSYANLRFNHTNGQFPSHTVGNNSFIVQSKKQEVRERKISESISSSDCKNLQAIYNSVNNIESNHKGGQQSAILNRTHFWDYHLLNQSDEKHSLVNDDYHILNSNLDLHNQLVIRQDTKRTRCGQFDNEMHSRLEHFLTFYCKQQEIKYKQGLNELAAPFLNLTRMTNNNVSVSQSYNYFVNFIDKFVPNFFTDSEFNSLQCFFFAFTLLMKYHDPNLNYFLQKNDISPEIYAYPWFITLFSSKVELDIVYNLWDLFLIENDQLLILYISLALMIKSKKLIMSVDPSVLPQTLSSLKIENLNDLKEIYALALQIRKQTPISFSSRISQLNVLQKGYHKHQSTIQEMKMAATQIQKYVAMPISPIEILHHLYPSVIQCPNPDCDKNSFMEKILCMNQTELAAATQQNNLISNQQSHLFKTFHGGLDWNSDGKNRTEDIGMKIQNNRQKECKYCSIKVLIPNELTSYVNRNDFLREVVEISKQNSIKVYKDKQLDFKTFDLRSQSKNQGYLNKTTLVSMNKFDQETLDSLISDFIEYKNLSHFSFIVSDYSTLDTDITYNQSLLYVDPKQQEIYTVQKFSSDFIEYGFPYISIVEGGFKVCHDIILYQGLKLNDHNADLCKFCLRSNNQHQQPRKQQNSILDFFTNVFSSKDASAAATSHQMIATPNIPAYPIISNNINTNNNTINNNSLFSSQKRTNSVEKYTIPVASFNINSNQIGYINNIPTTSSINSSKKEQIPSTTTSSDNKNQFVYPQTQNNNHTSNTNQSTISSSIIKNNAQSINRTSSLHNNNNNNNNILNNDNHYSDKDKGSMSRINPPPPIKSSDKVKTKQDDDEQNDLIESKDTQKDQQYSSVSRNQTDKSSRVNQVQASLSPQIKPKLLNKQYQQRTPTTKLLSNFQSLENPFQFSGSDQKQGEFKQFKINRDSKVKTIDLNERSLTIPNEDSFCDENIDEINLNQIHNAQNYSINSNQRSQQNEQSNKNPIVLAESSRVHDRNINSIEKGRETSNSKDKFSKPTHVSVQQPLNYQSNQLQQQQPSLQQLQQSLADAPLTDQKDKIRKQHHNMHNQQSFQNQAFGLNQVLNQSKIPIQVGTININLQSNSNNSNNNNNNGTGSGSISSLKEDFLKQQNNQDYLKKSSTLNSHAMKKIQNMGQVFSKQNKQNYFDLAKKQINQKNFKLRGLFQTHKVSRDVWNDFIQILWNKPFSFYECQNLKDKNSEEVCLFQNTPNNFKSSSRILILSEEFTISVSANSYIVNQLQLIKSGSKNFINHDKDGTQQTQGKEDKSNFVSIKSFFFMRNLLRITSKKFNPNILSFYFKIPNVFKSLKFESTQYYQFIEKFDLLQLKECILSKRLNEILYEIYQIISEESEKFEIKSLYNMDNKIQALDCIEKAKEYYTIQQNTCFTTK